MTDTGYHYKIYTKVRRQLWQWWYVRGEAAAAVPGDWAAVDQETEDQTVRQNLTQDMVSTETYRLQRLGESQRHTDFYP